MVDAAAFRCRLTAILPFCVAVIFAILSFCRSVVLHLALVAAAKQIEIGYLIAYSNNPVVASCLVDLYRSGANTYVWTRSLNTNYTSYVWIVTSSGMYTNSYTYSYGVLPVLRF